MIDCFSAYQKIFEISMKWSSICSPPGVTSDNELKLRASEPRYFICNLCSSFRAAMVCGAFRQEFTDLIYCWLLNKVAGVSRYRCWSSTNTSRLTSNGKRSPTFIDPGSSSALTADEISRLVTACWKYFILARSRTMWFRHDRGDNENRKSEK